MNEALPDLTQYIGASETASDTVAAATNCDHDGGIEL